MKFFGIMLLLLVMVLSTVFAQEWIARFNGIDNDPEVAFDITVDDIGNVYVVGFGYRNATWRDYLTIKYDGNGDTLWARYYDAGQAFYDDGFAVVVDDSGNVYVTGRGMESGNQMGLVTIKYDSDGVEKWINRYEGAAGGDDEGYDIVMDNDGYIYVTGKTEGATTYDDWLTIKYNSAGDTLWTATYNGSDGGFDRAAALIVDNSGNVYVTGIAYSLTDNYDYATIKYNASGVEQWVAIFDGEINYSDDQAYDIAVRHGYVFVTGESEGDGTSEDYVTIKYTHDTGDTVWVRRYNGPGNAEDRAHALVVDSLGNIYVTGGSFGTTQFDYATIKYYPNGDTAWVSRYDGPDSDIDEAMGIVLDSTGNVYVFGQSYATQPNSPEFDYLTVKYNNDGIEQWTHRYNGTGDANDNAYSIAIDSAGCVYVTGSSAGTGSLEDFLTIKYSVAGIEEDGGLTIPSREYRLSAHPNPFTSGTTIYLPSIGHGAKSKELGLYDVTGRLVRKWDFQTIRQSEYIVWNGNDQAGKQLPNGIYFCILTAGDTQLTKKLVMVR